MKNLSKFSLISLIVLMTSFSSSHIFSAQIQKSAEKPSGLVYAAPDSNFWIQPPTGWMIDNKPPVEFNVPVVFYPVGGSFHGSPAVMYAKAINKEKFTTLDNFIKDELNDFKQRKKTFSILKRREYKITDNKIAKIIEIEADSPNNFEAIAYIEEKPGISLIVLSAKNKKDYEAALKSFEELLSSYQFAGLHVDVSNKPQSKETTQKSK